MFPPQLWCPKNRRPARARARRRLPPLGEESDDFGNFDDELLSMFMDLEALRTNSAMNLPELESQAVRRAAAARRAPPRSGR